MSSLRSARLILLLFAFTGSLAEAKDLTASKPEREGLSPERLARIDAYMEQAVRDGTMVGGLGLIARHDRIVYSATWGQQDREAGRPMTPDTIFRIYSMSKPVTSVALMTLYEEGRFFLNDPVAKYIPELADLKVSVASAEGDIRAESDGTTSRSVGEGDATRAGEVREPARQPTIRDLLRHTAGFTYGVFGNTPVDKQYREARILANPDLKDMVEKLGRIPLQYDPGSRWHYSVAVDVQGRLIEVLTGQTLGAFLKARLFDPLGMKDTGFRVPADKLDRLARLYSPEGTAVGADAWLKPSTSKVLVPAAAEADRNFKEGATFESGGGGLVSTARDYLRFCQMLLNGGELDGARILSRKTVELMTTNHLGDVAAGMSRKGQGFGLGFAVTLDQGEIGELGSVGEYNWGGAAGTRFWIDPVEQLIGVFMVQSLPHRTRLADQFRLLTYQALVN